MKKTFIVGAIVLACALAYLTWMVQHYQGVASEQEEIAIEQKRIALEHLEVADAEREARVVFEEENAALEALVASRDSTLAEEVNRRMVVDAEAQAAQVEAQSRAAEFVGMLEAYVQASPPAAAALDSLLLTHTQEIRTFEVRLSAGREEALALRSSLASRDLLLSTRSTLIQSLRVEISSLRSSNEALTGANDALTSANEALHKALQASETRWKWAKRASILPPLLAFVAGKRAS